MQDDWRTIRKCSRADMLKRVARFRNLKGSDGGLPDSPLPECRRRLYAVIGFQPPQTDSNSATSPVGDDASAMPAIAIAEGFNLGYCKAKPGKGPLMHNHDTNETFIPMTGRWRCEWNEGEALEHVDLEPGKEHVLMFIIGGDRPQAEFTPRAMQRCAEYATAPARPRASPSAASRRSPRRRASKDGPARTALRRKPARRAGR